MIPESAKGMVRQVFIGFCLCTVRRQTAFTPLATVICLRRCVRKVKVRITECRLTLACSLYCAIVLCAVDECSGGRDLLNNVPILS